MNQAVAARPRWMITTRPAGEVLAATAATDESRIVLLGVPDGFTAPEIEGWLQDLLGVARETSKQDAEERPIPVLLHHTLTGLLFSHTELWDRAAAGRPCSAAFIEAGEAAGFGWVGDGEPQVRINGRPVEIQWVLVRDQSGREARAFAVDSRHEVEVELDWHGPAAGSGIRLAAAWSHRNETPVVPENFTSEEVEAASQGPLDPAESVFLEVAIPESRSTLRTAPAPDSVAAGGASGVASAALTETAVPHESVPDAPLEDRLTPRPDRPLGWQTVYEEAGEDEPPRDERRRGFMAWVAGLVGGGREESRSRAPGGRHEPPAAAQPPLPPASPASSVPAAPPAPDPASPEPPRAAAPPVAPAPPGHEVPAPVASRLAPAPLEVTELVPPTPEPAELTARAVDWRARGSAPAAAAEAPAAAAEAPAAAAPVPPARAPRAWPAFDEAAPRPRRRVPLRALLAWGLPVLALFAAGWWLGTMQEAENAGPGLASRAMRALGLGGARYDLEIATRPPGAWITVDGRDLARRTPAALELAPGEHLVTLTLPDLGSASFHVRGERGDRVVLDAPLLGSLAIRGADSALPIAVSVDGRSLGFVPVTLDSLVPGPHEVRFSGPGMASWGTTVTIRVNETTETIAHPMTSPATGVIEVRATRAGEEGAEPLNGAAVYVDGERRGTTPVTLELPRGPHSIRVEHQGEAAPVQVIDLPGGNQRFATFEFGLDVERGTLLALAPPARLPFDRPATISAALQHVNASDVREMWLHVRTPDGSWRRYQMTLLKAGGGVVGVAVHPPTQFDAAGRSRWYVSAISAQGDEYFTEIMTSEVAAPAAAAPPRGR